MMPAVGIRCHVCAAPTVDEVPGYAAFCRVTSDCQPWARGGRLGVCRTCGCAQKVIDPVWQAESDRIYAAYAIYHQSGGVEQAVFEQVSGQVRARSARLLERLSTQISLPAGGRLLDIGCGNGALLRAFSQRWPGWSLAGTELSDKYRPLVEGIGRVEALFTCMPDQVPGDFDLITLVHVSEHILDPAAFLSRLAGKLKAHGLLLIQVPDLLRNPYDLLIADHCTHFTESTLACVIRRAGYETVSVAADWVPKELTMVVRLALSDAASSASTPPSNALAVVARNLEWLERVVDAARRGTQNGHFGLFGTSIAAAWLASELSGTVEFFVDEDPHRVGKTYWGCPVYHPQDVPGGSHVFLALPPSVAGSVLLRIAKDGVTYYLPPTLPHSVAGQANENCNLDIDPGGAA